MKKILLVASAVALLAAGCNSTTSTSVDTNAAPPAASISPAQPEQTVSETPAPTASAKSATNAELNASLKSVDSNMDSLNADSANIDASLGEQPAP